MRTALWAICIRLFPKHLAKAYHFNVTKHLLSIEKDFHSVDCPVVSIMNYYQMESTLSANVPNKSNILCRPPAKIIISLVLGSSVLISHIAFSWDKLQALIEISWMEEGETEFCSVEQGGERTG